MITTFVGSQILALLPNSRLKAPMVPGPHTSWVMRMSTLTHTLSPGSTCALPPARASSFSVKVIGQAKWRGGGGSANGIRGEAGIGARVLVERRLRPAEHRTSKHQHATH